MTRRQIIESSSSSTIETATESFSSSSYSSSSSMARRVVGGRKKLGVVRPVTPESSETVFSRETVTSSKKIVKDGVVVVDEQNSITTTAVEDGKDQVSIKDVEKVPISVSPETKDIKREEFQRSDGTVEEVIRIINRGTFTNEKTTETTATSSITDEKQTSPPKPPPKKLPKRSPKPPKVKPPAKPKPPRKPPQKKSKPPAKKPTRTRRSPSYTKASSTDDSNSSDDEEVPKPNVPSETDVVPVRSVRACRKDVDYVEQLEHTHRRRRRRTSSAVLEVSSSETERDTRRSRRQSQSPEIKPAKICETSTRIIRKSRKDANTTTAVAAKRTKRNTSESINATKKSTLQTTKKTKTQEISSDEDKSRKTRRTTQRKRGDDSDVVPAVNLVDVIEETIDISETTTSKEISESKEVTESNLTTATVTDISVTNVSESTEQVKRRSPGSTTPVYRDAYLLRDRSSSVDSYSDSSPQRLYSGSRSSTKKKRKRKAKSPEKPRAAKRSKKVDEDLVQETTYSSWIYGSVMSHFTRQKTETTQRSMVESTETTATSEDNKQSGILQSIGSYLTNIGSISLRSRNIPRSTSPVGSNYSPRRQTGDSYRKRKRVVTNNSESSSKRSRQLSVTSSVQDASEEELRYLGQSSDDDTSTRKKGIYRVPGSPSSARDLSVSFPDQQTNSSPLAHIETFFTESTPSTEQEKFPDTDGSLKGRSPKLVLQLKKSPMTDYLTDRHSQLSHDSQLSGPTISSDDEASDVDQPTSPQVEPRWRRMWLSFYQVIRNMLLWIGLTCLSTNVYILSLFKKLRVWRDPFTDTAYNSDAVPQDPWTPSPETIRDEPTILKRITHYFTFSRNRNTEVTDTSDVKSNVGWCGFLGACLFLSCLVLLLSLVLVPFPAADNAPAQPGMFSYLEEQRAVSSALSALRESLVLLDKRTADEDQQMRLAIKELEAKRQKLEEQMVAIATLDRQQSADIEKLTSLTNSHSSQLQATSEDVSGVMLKLDKMKTEVDNLRTAIDVIRTTQEHNSQQLKSYNQQQEKIASSHEEFSTKISSDIELLRRSLSDLIKRTGNKDETFQQLLLDNKNWTADELEKLRSQLFKISSDKSTETEGVDELGARISDALARLAKVEQNLQSSVPTTTTTTTEIPEELIARLDSITTEVESLRNLQVPDPAKKSQVTALESSMADLKGQLETHMELSGGKFREIYKQIAQATDQVASSGAVSQIKLETIESKLAVMVSLQERLSKFETQQQVVSLQDEKTASLRRDVSQLIQDLKQLSGQHSEELSKLRDALSALKRDTGADKEKIALDILQNSADLQRIEELVGKEIGSLHAAVSTLQESTDKKIRVVVLEALSSVTQGAEPTRFFGDWLFGTFLSREQFDREQKNETAIVYPDQEELVKIVIAELQSKHKIDLKPSSGITLADIRYIVSDALQTFNEDKTGRADFALEALGGTVISIGCTETYYEGAPYASFMSVPLYRVPNPPNVALQPDITPGKCWAFKGHQGYMMIRLAQAVRVEGFSLEHLPKKLSLNNDLSSAPYKFTVRGVTRPGQDEPHSFGDFKYSDTGDSLQFFLVQKRSNIAYEIVELEIQSNHGNADYTCLYRIRVHGQPPKLS